MKMAFFISIICLSVPVAAQSSTNSSGGTATGTSGTVTYTVGQTACGSGVGTGGTVLEGVQVPLFLISGIAPNPEIPVPGVTAVPNPTAGWLTLTTPQDGKERYATVCAPDGTVLANVTVQGPRTAIDMQAFEPGAYLLHVHAGNTVEYGFKITKQR